MQKARVGVLALQGDFAAHIKAVEAVGATGVAVRTAEDVAAVDALILPGGESTTIGKLMVRYGIDMAIREAIADGKPVYGTCAGMILLAERIAEGAKQGGQPTLGMMQIAVARNAFGRQADSFEADIDAPEVAETPIRGVFIRAPYIVEIGPEVRSLAVFDGRIVLAQQGKVLASSFHPELTDDTRLHRYFISLVSDPAGTDTGVD